nr:hypothetical protein [Pseudoerythrocladia kornmannii]
MQRFTKTHFLGVKYKVRKIIYSELSIQSKAFYSIIFILFCPQNNINIIIFYCSFLLLVWIKVKSNSYISYNNFTNKLLVIKMIAFFLLLTIRNPLQATTNQRVLISCNTNLITSLSNEQKIIPYSLKNTVNVIYLECLRSVYRIEICSIISIFITKILLTSIHPQNILNNSNQYNKIKIHELKLIFTFALQISYLITNQYDKLIIAIQIRQNKTKAQAFNNIYKIIKFTYIYSIKSKNRIKQEAFNATQLNKKIFQENKYYEFLYNPILIKTKIVVIIYILALLLLVTSI